MRFLFPDFLFALSAIAIPVIVHFFNLRKYKKVFFTNVLFIKEMDRSTSPSRKLKHFWLLITRVLAIVFLVFAFAQPYIPLNGNGHFGENEAVSIYVDNSYSMETLNRDGSLFDEAKRRAREIVSSYNLNTKFQLLSNDFEGRYQHFYGRDQFLELLGDLKISNLSRGLSEVLEHQQDVAMDKGLGIRKLYVISDFQRNFISEKAIEADSSLRVALIKLESRVQSNVSIDSVWFLSPVHRPGIKEEMVIRLVNNSDQAVPGVSFKLRMNGKQKAIGSVDLGKREAKLDTLIFSDNSTGWKKGEVSITDYPITFDNQLFFTYDSNDHFSILSINEDAPSAFLEAVYGTDPYFRLTNVSVGNIDYAGLNRYPFIILNELNAIDEGLAQQLREFVLNGGNLIVFPSLKDVSGLLTLTEVMGTERPESIDTAGQKIISANFKHRVFEGVFELLPKKPTLPVAKKHIVYRHQTRTSKEQILEFAGNKTCLAQYQIGKGSLYLSAISLNEESSNLVRNALFVPLMYNIAFLSLRNPNLYYTIGGNEYLPSPRTQLFPGASLRLRKGSWEIIPDYRRTGFSDKIYVADQIQEPEIYSLTNGDALIANYAFNNSTSESDLRYLNEAEIREAFKGSAVLFFKPGSESIQGSIKAANNGRQLWKLCLILALVFLAAEILIIKFYASGKMRDL